MIGRHCNRCRAFTLIELMAVVLIILVLVAIVFRVTGYVQRKAAIATTKAQMAAIEAALESYKSDFGYYPQTQSGRISKHAIVESANGNTLYKALFQQGKVYLHNFPEKQIRVKTAWGATGVVQTNLCDVWGTPFNYYCSPRSVATNNPPAFCLCYNPGVAHGGQINLASFDLFSYGPDQTTYVPGSFYWGATGNNGSWLEVFTNVASVSDDITNWK
ncbi:MAG: hypothetical protein PCFJNLEI_02638 [Verrucomicrobiae bacterium]|nr:hypothetical protein [Verrucomicrobiae bacterium]